MFGSIKIPPLFCQIVYMKNNGNGVTKRVLLVTQYFYPENFKSNDIAFELAKRGYHVDALVGIPNYPQGKYYKGYGLFSKRREKKGGVSVYRVFQTPRGPRASALGLTLNYVSYAINASLWILFFFIFKKKYDACVVFQTSPITQAIPAVIMKKLKGTPVYNWILDIWPDSFISSIPRGKAELAVKYAGKVTEWVYKNSHKILVTSPGMMPLVNRKYDYSNKLVFFPNWCDDILKMPTEDIDSIGEGFIIMMAGNIADGIGIPYLIPVLEKLKNDQNVKFVFVGGGAMEKEFRDIVKDREWKNVLLTGMVPFSKIPSYYSKADAMLLTLKKTDLPHLKVTIPGRLQSYMAAGKPVLGMIDEGARSLIEAADCGFCVSAGESDALVQLIREVVAMDEDVLKEKGDNGRRYFEQHFTKDKCIDNLEHILFEL